MDTKWTFKVNPAVPRNQSQMWGLADCEAWWQTLSALTVGEFGELCEGRASTQGIGVSGEGWHWVVGEQRLSTSNLNICPWWIQARASVWGVAVRILARTAWSMHSIFQMQRLMLTLTKQVKPQSSFFISFLTIYAYILYLLVSCGSFTSWNICSS